MSVDIEQIEHNLGQKERKISMLEEEILDYQIKAEEYQQEILNLRELLAKKRTPLKPKEFNENDTLALLDCSNAGELFFDDDDFTKTPYKLAGKENKADIRKLTRNLQKCSGIRFFV